MGQRGRQVGYELPSGACPRNDALIRQMAAESRSLCSIARAVGSKNQQVRKYMTRHDIAYTYRHSVGPNNPQWRGGRILDKHGYVLLWRPDHPYANSGGYVREHRLVMEGILGRYLQPEEVVHHRVDTFEGRSNNIPTNLVYYGSNGEHLAETLAGKTPNWSPEGLRRIRAGDHEGAKRWFAANGHLRPRNPDGSFQKIDGPPLPKLKRRKPASPRTDRPSL